MKNCRVYFALLIAALAVASSGSQELYGLASCFGDQRRAFLKAVGNPWDNDARENAVNVWLFTDEATQRAIVDTIASALGAEVLTMDLATLPDGFYPWKSELDTKLLKAAKAGSVPTVMHLRGFESMNQDNAKFLSAIHSMLDSKPAITDPATENRFSLRNFVFIIGHSMTDPHTPGQSGLSPSCTREEARHYLQQQLGPDSPTQITDNTVPKYFRSALYGRMGQAWCPPAYNPTQQEELKRCAAAGPAELAGAKTVQRQQPSGTGGSSTVIYLGLGLLVVVGLIAWIKNKKQSATAKGERDFIVRESSTNRNSTQNSQHLNNSNPQPSTQRRRRSHSTGRQSSSEGDEKEE